MSFEHYTVINHEIMSFNLSAQKKEDTVYDEVKVPHKTPEQAADMNGKLKRNVHNIQVLLLLGTFLVKSSVFLFQQ